MPPTPLPPSQPPSPSDPSAAAAAAPPSPSTPPPPPSYYAPPSSSYFDPLAPSTSSQPIFDFRSLLSVDNYPSVADFDFDIGFPENYQPYSANTPPSLQNIHPFPATNNFLSPQNYQPYAGYNYFLSHQNHQSILPGNYQPYAGNNNILSHENYGNSSLSPDSDNDAGNNDYYFSLPYQHQPLPVNWRENLPVGVKFRPTDGELIVYYLKPHITNGATPSGGPVTTDRDVYDYEPHQLLGLGEDHGDGRRYFITPARKIGKLKTDRIITTKTGFWKPTQAPKPVFFSTTRSRSSKYGSKEVGVKIPLAFYNGRKKTQWLMQELKLPKNDDAAASSSKHHLEFVVAIVYYHHRRQR